MLQTTSLTTAWISVFCAGLAMAPVLPTTLAMVGDAFPRMTATAMGFVITCGWIGLAVSSQIIGNVASTSSLNSALYILPVFSLAMVVVNLAMRPMLRPRAVATVTDCRRASFYGLNTSGFRVPILLQTRCATRRSHGTYAR